MSGHSKWNNIKKRKEAVDQKRGKIFTKLGREIQVAIKEGGPNPAENTALQAAISRAKSYNMPNDTIKRAIDNAANSDASAFTRIDYEGYGPAGVAIIVQALTDNRNRTAGEVRHIFDKYGGNLGKDGSVSFQFEKRGELILEKEKYPDEDQVMLDAMEAGCQDIVTSEDYYEIITKAEDYNRVLQQLSTAGYEFADLSVGPQPLVTVEVDSEEDRENLEKLIDRLEEVDDVQEVFHNWASDD